MTELLITFSIIIILFVYAVHKGFQANKVDWKHPVVNCIDGWMRIYCKSFQRLKYDQLNIAESGNVLIVCNHVSGLDPMVLLTACERPLRFMIAKEEYERPVLHSLFRLLGCIPVERKSKPEVAFRQTIRELNKGEAVVIFPHGGIHTDNDVHKPIKAGVLKLAKLTNSEIIPARLTGIRKEGSSFIPLFLRGHVRLQVFKHLPPDYLDQKDAKKKLGDLLLGKIPSIEN
ncbi:MAG: 1-acyl-sn-glycerol-3-phosphate acyltransferase [Gammaproteobacteria bacterium]|nr:MAG: 1-acyl-sn-glycerol-3-phosphate acyltransferase [Gammaproteobacteria bacterium]